MGRRSAIAALPTISITSSRRTKSRYADYTGCGNTLNANQPIVRRLIQDSLRYWVTQMHVDGFRFDLASILSRDEAGRPLPNPPVLWDIESDPLLAGTKLIAEAWDAAGLYQVGSFVGDTWQEWNGRFRDDVRRFLKGDDGSVSGARHPAAGQPGHLRPRGARGRAEHQFRHLSRRLHPQRSGLLQRQAQRGQRRGQSRRLERQSELELRRRKGRPTMRRSRRCATARSRTSSRWSCWPPARRCCSWATRCAARSSGNNNAYCQDSEISWFDWSLLERHADIHRFVKAL